VRRGKAGRAAAATNAVFLIYFCTVIRLPKSSGYIILLQRNNGAKRSAPIASGDTAVICRAKYWAG
jgi:hypothetical protein